MRSGDRCGQCDIGRMMAYCSKTRGSSRVTYCRCSNADCKAKGKQSAEVDALGRIIFIERTIAGTSVSHSRTETR